MAVAESYVHGAGDRIKIDMERLAVEKENLEINRAQLALKEEMVAIAKKQLDEERKRTVAFETAVAKFGLLAESMAENYRQNR